MRKRKSKLSRVDVHPFETIYPGEYNALLAILKRKLGSDHLRYDTDFRDELSYIIDAYERDRTRKQYREDADRLLDELSDLGRRLQATRLSISQLDLVYRQRILVWMMQNPLDDRDWNLGLIQEHLEQAKLAVIYFQIALTLETRFEVKPEGRSRPRLPYYVPAAQLMHLWEEYTHTKVVTPKGAAKGRESTEAAQPSTEFVRIGLTMIDPKVSTANAMTLIKRVLSDRAKQGQTLYELITPPNFSDMDIPKC